MFTLSIRTKKHNYNINLNRLFYILTWLALIIFYAAIISHIYTNTAFYIAGWR